MSTTSPRYEYIERPSGMSREQWRQIVDLYNAAVEDGELDRIFEEQSLLAIRPTVEAKISQIMEEYGNG